MIKLRIPTWATIALSVLAGVLAVLNVTTFGFPPVWAYLTMFGLAILASIGIAPLTGPALQNVLHISHAVALSLAGALTTLVAAVTTLDWSTDTKGIIIGILTLLGGVLFGPAFPTPAPAPVPPRA